MSLRGLVAGSGSRLGMMLLGSCQEERRANLRNDFGLAVSNGLGYRRHWVAIRKMQDARFSFARVRSLTGSLVVAGGVCLAMGSTGPLHAGDNRLPPASLGATQTVYLDYRELSHSVNNWGLSLDAQTAAFKKEPALGGRNVTRGTLKLGSGTDHFLPLIWDQSSGKLYLDLNRNHDFTDDPGGVFTCTQPTRYASNYQTFTNIHLSFKTSGGSHPALVDLSLYRYSQIGGSIGSRSYWEGKISLQGRDWQLGIIENVTSRPGSTDSGYLLLRPWAARNKPFFLQDGSLDGFQFSRDLFFDGEAYHLNCAYLEQEGGPRYKVDLEKRQAELGELKLSGKYIKRLVLPGTKFTVVLDQPEPVVKVPVGSYGRCQVQLEQGGAQAYREATRFNYSPGEKATTVTVTKPAVLTVGGPLTNSITVSRRGRALNLGYQCLGAGGEAYTLLGARREPEFAAYRGGKKIASGKFQFG
jgi:hypothetical protein